MSLEATGVEDALANVDGLGAKGRRIDLPRVRSKVDRDNPGPYIESKPRTPRLAHHHHSVRRSNRTWHYAVLLAVGGIIGYTKAGSRPSLIAGLASAAALLALGLSTQSATLGMGLGALVAILLAAFFGYRFLAKTRKFMPAGMLAVVSTRRAGDGRDGPGLSHCGRMSLGDDHRHQGSLPAMPSPFPGMDPFLESQGFWQDFHTSMLTLLP